MRLAYLIALLLAVLGQASSPLSSITKTPGEEATLEISVISEPARVPITLK